MMPDLIALAGLNRATELAQEAVNLTPQGSNNRPAWLNNLGNRLLSRYQLTRAKADLDRAIELAQEAVDLTPQGSNDRPAWLNNLGSHLLDTTARIQPKSLLPSGHSGAGLRSKLVDFAITLKPDAHLQQSYPNLDPLEEGLARSFNSTCPNTVLQEPIAISIETKTVDGHNNEAIMQLFTWSIAHLRRLSLFTQGTTGLEAAILPALPLLSVHGGLWKIYAISWTEDNGYNLWYLFTCGCTDTPLGFYKVFTILQLLMHWADTVYRGWIRSVIPLTGAELA